VEVEEAVIVRKESKTEKRPKKPKPDIPKSKRDKYKADDVSF
jgi:hypothetical protein